MYIEQNEMTAVFNPERKYSMIECVIKVTPTLTLGDLTISFGGDNFTKLLIASGVSQTLVDNLLLRKKNAKKIEAINRITNHEYFFKSENDDIDVFLCGSNIGELRHEDEDGSYLQGVLSQKDGFNECVETLKLFPVLYRETEARFDSKNDIFEKIDSKKNKWFALPYTFENDGIIISPELGFKIQGDAFEKLKNATKQYVELHGQFVVEQDLEKQKQVFVSQKEIFDIFETDMLDNLNHESEEDQKALLDFARKLSRAFSLYTF